MPRPLLVGLAIAIAAVVAALLWSQPWSDQPEPNNSPPSASGFDPAGGNTGNAGAATLAPVDGVVRGNDPNAVAREAATTGLGLRWTIRGRLRVDPSFPLTAGGSTARILAYLGQPSDESGVLRGMLAQLSRLSPNRDRHGSSTRTGRVLGRDGEAIAEAIVSADGSFAVSDVPVAHVRLYLDHDYYGLVEPLPVHLPQGQRDAPPDRAMGGQRDDQPEARTSGAIEVDVGALDTYLGALVRARIAATLDVRNTLAQERQLRAQLMADPDPMSAIRDPQGFFAQVADGGSRSAPLGRDAAFVFRAVRPGPQNRVALRAGALLGQTERFALAAGELLELQLEVTRGVDLAVTVLDPEDRPVPGVTVVLTPDGVGGDISRAALMRYETTRVDGHVAFAGLARTPHRLRCSAKDFRSASRAVDMGDGDTRVTVRLERGASISGRVINGAGAPIVGAQVAAAPLVEIPMIGDISDKLGSDVLAGQARGSAYVTDESGQFAIGGLEDGTFHIVADHEDYLSSIAKGVATGESVELVLGKGGSIVGRVVGEGEGRPLTEFAVELMTKMIFIERPGRALDIADSADGVFRIDGVEPGRAKLRIRSPGWGTLNQRVKVEEGRVTDLGDVAMPAPAKIMGRIVDEVGVPIGGARISQRQRGILDNPILAAFFGDLRAHSQDDGTFVLDNVSPGRLSLTATADGFATGNSERLQLGAGQTLEGVVITLGHGATLVGRLIVSPGVDPTQWDILPTRPPSGAMGSARPDQDGWFRFENLDPGAYDVQAIPQGTFQQLDNEAMNGWVPGETPKISEMFEAFNDVMVHSRARLEVGEETTIELDARGLAEGQSPLELRVLLAGRPVSTAYAEIQHVQHGRGWFGFVQDGNLQLHGVPAGDLRVQVRSGLTMAPLGEMQSVAFEPDSGPVIIDLPGGKLGGQVLDAETGAPLAAALVRIYREDDKSVAEGSEFGFLLTDDEGLFAFDGLNPGSYTVVADNSMNLGSGNDVASRVRGVRVDGGAAPEITLRARPAAGLHVTVVDRAGRAIAGATVMALGENGKPVGAQLAAVTNSSGEALLSGLPDGAVRVVARGGAWSPGEGPLVSLRAGDRQSVSVRLEEGTPVSITPTGAGGQPLLGATIAARPAGGSAPAGRAWVPAGMLMRGRGPGGQVDLGPLAPGGWEFLVVHPAAAPFTVSHTVPVTGRATLLAPAPQ